MLKSGHYKSLYPERRSTRDRGLKDQSQILTRIARLKIVSAKNSILKKSRALFLVHSLVFRYEVNMFDKDDLTFFVFNDVIAM